MQVTIVNRFTGAVIFVATVSATSLTPVADALAQAIAAGVNLAGAKLSGVNLDGVAFAAGQNLQGVDFRGSTLRNAQMNYVDLTQAHFGNTDCTGADFTGATLTDADLRNARGIVAVAQPLQSLVTLNAQQLAKMNPDEEPGGLASDLG